MGNTTHHHQDNSHLVKQAEERMQRERHEHERRMKELENANKEKKRQQLERNIKHVKGIMTDLEKSVKKDQDTLKDAQEVKSFNTGKKEKLEDDIKNFSDYKAQKLQEHKIQLGLDKAESDYKRDYNEIYKAIETTGQTEQNVGKFLKLTLSLIGATMNTEAETNKLDIALATFGKIMNDECQDKLTIDTYFNEKNLERFIFILAKEGYTVLDDLICDEKETFEDDILALCDKGISESEEKGIEENKENKESEKEGEELCVYLLKKWKLDQYWGKIKEDGWDDADDWTELTEDDLTDIIDKKGKRKQFMKKCKEWKKGEKYSKFKLMKKMEIKNLEKICLKPDSWNGIQNEKVANTKEGLLELSPILGLFFGKMNDAVIQISELLSYKKQLSDAQLNAVKMRNQNGKKLKAIKMRKADSDERGKWIKHTQCQIYSDSSKQWFTGKIIELRNDNEGEWLNVQYAINNETRNKEVQRYSDAIKPLQLDIDEKDMQMELLKDDEKDMDIQKQCQSLITASIVGISVTDTMLTEFNRNKLTQRGLTLAIGVESACMRIIRGQGQIRQSVFLAQEILSYKPANMSSEKTRNLWTAIDGGITQIFKSALEMVKVSAQYFAFFLRFQSAFQYYVTCYDKGKDTQLMVSLERLRKDVRDFNAFTSNFTKKIKELSNTSMNCIEKCVKAQIGAKNWEDSRSSFKITEKLYLESKKLYDQKGFVLDNELDKKKQDQIEFEQKEAGAIYQVNMLTKRIKQNNDYLVQCQTALNQLGSVIIE